VTAVLTQRRYTFGVRRPGSMADARQAVEAALRSEGFGVITQIDVQATVRERLGVERTPYLILGACNPQLAHRAIEADPSIGALLPCNVVLREDGSDVVIDAMDPLAALGIVDDPAVHAIALEAHDRLARAIATLAG
jgi:uncharacterized protein (DUF302 family)